MTQPSTDFDIEKYKRMILRNKWWFIIPVVVVVPCSIVLPTFLPDEYKGASKIVATERRVPNPLVREQDQRVGATQRRIAVQEQMLSYTTLSRVIAKLGYDMQIIDNNVFSGVMLFGRRVLGKIRTLAGSSTDTERDITEERLIRTLQRDIRLRSIGDNVIEISYSGRDAEFNSNVVNTVVGEFIESSLREQRTGSENSLLFLGKTLAEFRKRLEEEEAELRRFREERQGDIPADTNVHYTNLFRDRDLLLQNQTRLSVIEAEVESIEDTLSAEDETVVSELTRGINPKVAELERQVMSAEVQLQMFASQFSDKHPRVVQAREQLAGLKTQLEREEQQTVTAEVSSTNPAYVELAQQKRALDIERTSLLAQNKNLETRITELKAKVGQVPRQQEEYDRITRDYEAYQKLYNDIFLQYQAAALDKEISDREESPDVYAVIDRAFPSKVPVGPDRQRMSAMGIVAAICIGAGLAVLHEYLDRSMHGIADAKQIVQLPMLAIVPTIVTEADLARQRKRRYLTLGAVVCVVVIAGVVGATLYVL
jgi:polysaccharide chain length determinant protein (PEP-CTERM system associated)